MSSSVGVAQRFAPLWSLSGFAPLLHRARWAQMQAGLCSLLDEPRGSDQCDPPLARDPRTSGGVSDCRSERSCRWSWADFQLSRPAHKRRRKLTRASCLLGAWYGATGIRDRTRAPYSFWTAHWRASVFRLEQNRPASSADSKGPCPYRKPNTAAGSLRIGKNRSPCAISAA
jgi:hypothetical protein